jgi:hypothetical protein
VKKTYANQKGQNDTKQGKSGYIYLGHDHDLVAWEAKLFNSLSENDFGTPVRIRLVISPPKVSRSNPNGKKNG